MFELFLQLAVWKGELFVSRNICVSSKWYWIVGMGTINTFNFHPVSFFQKHPSFQRQFMNQSIWQGSSRIDIDVYTETNSSFAVQSKLYLCLEICLSHVQHFKGGNGNSCNESKGGRLVCKYVKLTLKFLKFMLPSFPYYFLIVHESTSVFWRLQKTLFLNKIVINSDPHLMNWISSYRIKAESIAGVFIVKNVWKY